MKYVSLLRGINVGGNNIIKMLVLKECFEKMGYTNVITFIQSGNVIFESKKENKKEISTHIESVLSKTFNYESLIVLISHLELKKIVVEVPKEWNTRDDIRCYLGFLKEPMTAKDAAQEIKINEKVDSMKVGKGVLYMTTLMSGRTKSGFNKMIGKKVYKSMTIRNYTTTKKVLTLMGK